MNYRVLYRKYRPTNFDDVVGQKTTIRLLKESIINEKISHAYIFSGPRGTGKTSCAKIFAKTVNCLESKDGLPCGKCENCLNINTSNDIYEIDAASNNGVDQIREIVDNIKLAPINSKYKIYIIDEVHMLSQSAFNALLLTLEEPPAHVIFILATTNIENVPITVLSRCQRMDFKKISTKDMIERLNYIVKEENIDITQDAIREICDYAEGGLRDALSILDQLSKENKQITDIDVLSSIGLISTIEINNLLDAINNNNIDFIMNFVQKCRDISADFKSVVKKMIDVLKNKAVKVKMGDLKERLSYDDYKNMCFELASCLYKNNINIDSYALMELLLLKYVNVNCENITSFPQQKKEEIKLNNENLKNEFSNTVLKEIKFNDSSDYLVNIRLSNCFAEATKTDKINILNGWTKFVSEIDENKYRGLLEDCEVVLASKRIIVLSTQLEQNMLVINDNLEKISDYYLNFSNIEYKFICITQNRWMKAMNEYKNNLQNGIKYIYEEEKLEIKDDNITNLLEDVFINDKIEIV